MYEEASLQHLKPKRGCIKPHTLPRQVSGREDRGSALLCLDTGVSVVYPLPEVNVKAVELNETLGPTVGAQFPLAFLSV